MRRDAKTPTGPSPKTITLDERALALVRRAGSAGVSFEALVNDLATRGTRSKIRIAVARLEREGWILQGDRVEHGHARVAVEHCPPRYFAKLTPAQRARRVELTRSEAA